MPTLMELGANTVDAPAAQKSRLTAFGDMRAQFPWVAEGEPPVAAEAARAAAAQRMQRAVNPPARQASQSSTPAQSAPVMVPAAAPGATLAEILGATRQQQAPQ